MYCLPKCGCVVCHAVRLYSVEDIAVMSGDVVRCSVMCDTLVDVSVFNISVLSY